MANLQAKTDVRAISSAASRSSSKLVAGSWRCGPVSSDIDGSMK
jgi:hypothetical protein